MIRPLLNVYKNRRRQRVIRRAFGQCDPHWVTVIGGANALRVDPEDNRVRKILLYNIARGRAKTNQVFWQDAAAAMEPTVVLDIGLNYGECLFTPTYPAGAQLHGFEANPSLIPYLNETIAAHPNRDAITLYGNAVSDASGQTLHLAISQQSSGISHLTGAAASNTVAVQSVRIDDIIARPTASDRLLVKLDIEGAEPLALAGMPDTLAAAGTTMVFMEFSAEMLADRGHDVPAFWALLCERFTIHVCSRTGEATPLAACDWADVPRSLKSTHCDLILTIGDDPRIDTFLTRWRTRDAQRAAA